MIFIRGGIISYNNKIRLYGSGKTEYSKNIYEYDDINNTYNSIGELEYNFIQGDIILFNDILYLITEDESNKIYNNNIKIKDIDTIQTIIKGDYEKIVSNPMGYDGYKYEVISAKSSTYGYSLFLFNMYDSPNTLHKIDTYTGEIQELAPPPIYLSEARLVTMNDFIYITGCGKYNGTPAPIYKYDIPNNTYTKLTDFSQFSSTFHWVNGQTVLVGTNIYILGNGASEEQKTDNYKYDITNNSLVKMSDIPYPFYDFCNAVNIKTDIYLMGSSAKGYEYTMYKYDTLTDTYTQIQNAKYNLKYSKATTDAYGNIIYFFGEDDDDQYLSRAYKYNPTTNTFSENTRMPFQYRGINCNITYNPSSLADIYLLPDGGDYCIYSYRDVMADYEKNAVNLIAGTRNNAKILDDMSIRIDDAVYCDDNYEIQNYQFYIGNGTKWVLKEGSLTKN